MSSAEAEIDPIGKSLMTEDSLRNFIPSPLKGEWLVNALEMIVDYLISLKYDLSVEYPILPQLSAIAKRCGSPEIERKKIWLGMSFLNAFHKQLLC